MSQKAFPAISLLPNTGTQYLLPNVDALVVGAALLYGGVHPTLPGTRELSWSARAVMLDPALAPSGSDDYRASDGTWKPILGHNHTFASLTSKPTTLAGYGITDAAALSHTHTFASLTSKPTTLAGYGITDAAALSHSHTFASLTSKPTTLAGYGITDAQALDSDLTAIAALTTTAFGRSVLTQIDGASIRSLIGAGTSSFDGVFASLTSKPTTLLGYGITDAQALLVSGTNIKTINGTTLLGAGDITISGGGGTPAGSGTELQYRNGSSFGAVTGSSVSGSNVTFGGELQSGTVRVGGQNDGGTGAKLSVATGVYTLGWFWGGSGFYLTAANALLASDDNQGMRLSGTSGLQLINGGAYIRYDTSSGFKVLQNNGLTPGSMRLGQINVGTSTLTTPVVDIVTGVGTGLANEAACLRLRHSATDGNTQCLVMGVSNSAIGGGNNGYSYISSTYWGSTANQPLVLNPGSGPVIIGDPQANSNYPLSVAGTIGLRATANTGSGEAGSIKWTAGGYGGTMASITGVFEPQWYQGMSLVFRTNSGADVAGANASVDRMTIKAGGNVLIGTDTDDGSNKLQVAGGVTFTGSLTSAFQTISADPTISDIPTGATRIVKNTTTGECRTWINDGGTMKKSAAFT